MLGFRQLDDGQRIDAATVADREDITAEHLRAAAADFLQRTGWTDVDPELCADLAVYMAGEAAEIAEGYPVGTRLHADYDRTTEEWAFSPVTDRVRWNTLRHNTFQLQFSIYLHYLSNYSRRVCKCGPAIRAKNSQNNWR